MHWFWLAFAIVSEVIATSALKYSEGFTKLWPSLIVVLGYGMAFWGLSLTLKTLSIGVAYAIWAGVGIVLIALVGVLFMGDKADLPGIAGIAMIIGGVIMLNAYSSMGGHG